MAIQVVQLSGPGTYKFISYGTANTYGSYNNTDDPAPNGDLNYYYTDGNLPGSVTITKIDAANKNIQGIFSFDAESKAISGQLKHITEGNFNVNY